MKLNLWVKSYKMCVIKILLIIAHYKIMSKHIQMQKTNTLKIISINKV